MRDILRANVRTGQITREPASGDELKWGGRSFIVNLLLREVPPTCNPIGRHNKLIFASGLLADTQVTTIGQTSIGGKSPLTGGVKESNVGGSAGRKLSNLGIRAIVVEDIPSKPETNVLFVSAKEARIDPFPELKGRMVRESLSMIRAKYGKKIGIYCIGPAGEMLMYGAGIACPDDRDLQVRYAARGGLGALMGSKGLKAVVLDDSDSEYKPDIFDAELLKNTSKWLTDYLLKDPKTENRHLYGTPAILAQGNSLGMIPTRNFSAGSFEYFENMTGEKIRDIIHERKGEGRSGTPCVSGCVIQCSNVFPDKNGKKIVASIQYENITLLGPNCGIGDVDEIAELNDLCNEVGVDAIETGAAIGVAMEAGVVPFGDAEGAKDLVRQIGKGTYLGRVLGNGSVTTGRVLGIRRVPAIKGQAIPGYDPRAIKGNGVLYIMSPMGADHTAGNAFETAKTMDPLKEEGQIEASQRLQTRAALLDTLGLCLFVRIPFTKQPEMFCALLKGRYGWDMSVSEVLDMSRNVIASEREFNRRAGVSEDFFPIPEFMEEEPLPPKNAVFDIPMERMKKLWDIKLPADQF
jgi:aldehyde:ferredoxin oxidoreductase